jgi:Ca-activated chloride channel family protein
MNAHEQARELLSRYVDGAVTKEERRYAEQLLRESEELRAYMEELKCLDVVLDAWVPEPPTPTWQAQVERNTLGRAMTIRVPRRRWALALSFGGASCAVAAVLVLMVTGRMPERQQILSQPVVSGPQQTQPPTPPTKPMLLVNQLLQTPAIAGGDVAYSTVAGARTSGYLGDEIVAPEPEPWRYGGPFHTEEYDRIYENRFLAVAENPLSTFSIDVDTASYANIRRFLRGGQLPPEDAVRIEEMINYFGYDYPQPRGDAPFSITLDRGVCPWAPEHQLVRVGLRGRVHQGELPPSNLVFLIDVSGSMDQPNKLPLLKTAFLHMVERLTAQERVAIVVYAGAAGLVLESTAGDQKATIRSAIQQLRAGGSTAGGEGIQLAYEIAQKHFIQGGNNRVILATDGDFNVGVSSTGELVRLIEEECKAGIFLTVLGFGTDNYNDHRMEQLADKGNGNYYYIDTEREGRKVLGEELGSTLFTIAKDVKIQVEFNPAHVKAYRLIGYENRVLAKEDFNDDTKDAGELGAGHTVTALYEIVPAGSAEATASVDPLIFQQTTVVPSDDMMVVKLRYKAPGDDTSRLLTQAIEGSGTAAQPTGDLQFAAAVAEFGLLLRNSEFKGAAAYDHAVQTATASLGEDSYGYRAEFIELVRTAKSLDHRSGPGGEPGIQFKGP